MLRSTQFYATKFLPELNTKTVIADKKLGRNEPCSCGSGKKYKKCCGK